VTSQPRVPRQPRVLDASALVALFAAEEPVMRLWREADVGQRHLLFPACAVAEASHQLGATFGEWEALLWPAEVELVPLDGSDVFDTARMAGTLAVRHTVAVAQAVRGAIVTRAPWQYPPGAGPLRVL
jgi:hypothetical protein